jgi:hypothetical protein
MVEIGLQTAKLSSILDCELEPYQLLNQSLVTAGLTHTRLIRFELPRISLSCKTLWTMSGPR